jgi:hypothetical protein
LRKPPGTKLDGTVVTRSSVACGHTERERERHRDRAQNVGVAAKNTTWGGG